MPASAASTAQGTANSAATAASTAQATANGKISAGGAASDVNSNTTTISGGKIRTGIIESTGYDYSSGNFSNVGTQINLDNGLIRSKNFAVTSAGDALFKGSITGGTISIGSNFSVDSVGNVNATNANLTGVITATAGTIGGWQITAAGYLINSSTKLKINPATPSIEIYDSSNAKRLDIHYGSLTYLGSNTIYIDPPAITLPYNDSLTGNYDSGPIFSSGVSFDVGQAGTYQKQISWDAVYNVGYISNNGNSNSLTIGRGVEIRDGSGNVVGNIYVNGASSNYGGGTSQALSWPAYTGYSSLSFPTVGTYYAYTYYYYYYSINYGYGIIYGNTWDYGSISYEMENNLVEITDGGIQVSRNTTQYVKLPRDNGYTVLQTKGESSFWGNTDEYAVRVTSNYSYGDTTSKGMYLYAGGTAINVYSATKAINIEGGSLWLQTNTAYKPGGGSWSNTSSDRRVKQNENELSGSLDIIKTLKPKTFEFKNQNRPEIEKGIQIGFIAQDVEEVRPNWVHTVPHTSGSFDIISIDPTYYDENKSGSVDIKTISFGTDMTAILVGAIKELNAKVEMLEAKLSGSL